MLDTNLLSPSCSNSAPFTPVIDKQTEMASNDARMKVVIPPFLLIANDADAWRLVDTGGPLVPSPLSVARARARVRLLLFIAGTNFV